VKVEDHLKCLRVGVGYFQPNLNGGQRRVLSPFLAVLVKIIEKCVDGKFSSIGTALDPGTLFGFLRLKYLYQ
jgi:hypothetical protein